MMPEAYKNFSLVYQGGHHNVYCDGSRHFKTGGGFCNVGNLSLEKHIAYAEAKAFSLMKAHNLSFNEAFFSRCDCKNYAAYS